MNELAITAIRLAVMRGTIVRQHCCEFWQTQLTYSGDVCTGAAHVVVRMRALKLTYVLT